MRILVIIHHRFFLNALFRYRQVYVNRSLLIGRRRQRRDLNRIQGLPGVTVRQFCQMPQGRFIRLDFYIAQPPLLVRQCPSQQFKKFLLG